METTVRYTAPRNQRVGVLECIPTDGSPKSYQDLVCCKHCGFIWPFDPKKAKGRGWCFRCDGHLCGRAYCRGLACCSWQQGIDNMETGQPIDYRPIHVSTAGLILPE